MLGEWAQATFELLRCTEWPGHGLHVNVVSAVCASCTGRYIMHLLGTRYRYACCDGMASVLISARDATGVRVSSNAIV